MKALITTVALFLTSMVGATDFNTGEPTTITTKPEITSQLNVELTRHNSVSIVGPIGSSLSSEFIAALLQNDDEEVVIYIDSPGGSIIAGNEMISAMKSSGKKTKCVAKFAASMAFIILQACDERYVTRDGILMQHQASYGVSGNSENNKSLLAFIERLIYMLDLEQAERLGISYEDFKNKTIRDWWFTSQDGLREKAVDGVAQVTCSTRLIKEVVQREIQVFIFTVEVKMSKCPLIKKMEPVKKGKRAVDLDSLKTLENIKKLNQVGYINATR